MDAFNNAILGLLFLGLAIASTFLMFKLWGYPFDHEKLKSSAPPLLMLLHRAIGYAFLAIYIYMMWQMLPRLWNYQVELPARTVAHLTLGMTIGIILIIKIMIVRFFKHLESTLIPFLGTTLLICTTLLIGLSVPIAFKETFLNKQALGGTAFSTENIDRVKKLLVKTSLAEQAPLENITTISGLKRGREVLLNNCVQCHDLRTVLMKPRTPDMWIQTVERMAERSFFDPISIEDQWYVSAYLIAISPDLKRSVQQRREQEEINVKTKVTATLLGKFEPIGVKAQGQHSFDLTDTKKVFEVTCSGCHSLRNVENNPPETYNEAYALISKMIDEGLDASKEDLEKIIFYLTKTYAQ